MAKTILVAGKERPASEKFTDALVLTGRNVAVTCFDEDADAEYVKKTVAEKKQQMAMNEEALEKEAASGMVEIPWNKISSISARTVVLQAENLFGALDEAVLFFDESYLASSGRIMDAEECDRMCNEQILSWQYLALELIEKFEKNNSAENPGTLVFLLNRTPDNADALKKPSLKNGINAIASPVLSGAAAAFEKFAENMAAICRDLNYVNVILVKSDNGMDIVQDEAQEAKWLCEYMESVRESRKRPSPKKLLSWVTPGQKKSSGFFLFNLFKSGK